MECKIKSINLCEKNKEKIETAVYTSVRVNVSIFVYYGERERTEHGKTKGLARTVPILVSLKGHSTDSCPTNRKNKEKLTALLPTHQGFVMYQ